MNLLLIDDDPEYHAHIVHALQAMEQSLDGLDYCSHPEQAADLIASGRHWDLHLVDWYYAQSSTTGYELISAIFHHNRTAEVALCTNLEARYLEPGLVELISNGRVTLLEKMEAEQAYLERLITPGRNAVHRILILEDDVDDAAMVADAFQKNGTGKFSTVIARDLIEAREQVAKNRFDGFVLDYRLEGNSGNGMDFYRSLPPSQRDKPVVLFTGSGALDLDMHTVHLVAAGQIRFLSKKTFHPESLTACFLR